MWRFADVHEGENYRLHLCSGDDGERSIRLVAIGSDADICPNREVRLITAIVPDSLIEALKLRNLAALAQQVLIDNGEPFFVDAHGIWEAASEARQLDSGVPFHEIQWITDRAPKYPQR